MTSFPSSGSFIEQVRTSCRNVRQDAGIKVSVRCSSSIVMYSSGADLTQPSPSPSTDLDRGHRQVPHPNPQRIRFQPSQNPPRRIGLPAPFPKSRQRDQLPIHPLPLEHAVRVPTPLAQSYWGWSLSEHHQDPRRAVHHRGRQADQPRSQRIDRRGNRRDPRCLPVQ